MFATTGDHPKVFISYSHESPAHENRVLQLCRRLRADCFDAVIDQFVIGAFPPQGWPKWQAGMLEKADFVLLVCTEVYLRRFESEEEAGIGLGVRSEGLNITNRLYRAGGLNTKTIPIVFTESDVRFVPASLSGSYCSLETESGFEKLYRHFRREPGVQMPPLGRSEPLPLLSRDGSSGFAGSDEFSNLGRGQSASERIPGANLSVDQLQSLAAMLGVFAVIADDVSRAGIIAKLPQDVRAAVRIEPGDAFDPATLMAAAISFNALERLFRALVSAGVKETDVKQLRERTERFIIAREAGVLLRQLDIAEDELYRLYCKSANGRTALSFRDGLDRWLETLIDMGSDEARLGEFMERVHQCCRNSALDVWLGQTLKNRRSDIRRQLAAEKAAGPTNESPYLAVMLNTVGLQPGEVPSLEYWLWQDENTEVLHDILVCPDGDVSRAFFAVLDEASRRCGTGMIIEFLVAREQFLLAPERWPTTISGGDSTLGSDYVVVMRWRDRARGGGPPAATPNWIKRTEVMRKQLDQGAASALLWVGWQQLSTAALMRRIGRESNAVECVAFGFVPPEKLSRAEGDLVGAALVGGAPYVCIFSVEPGDWAMAKDELDSLVRLGVHDIPQGLLDARLRGSHLGTSASLIWDRPDHFPGPLAPKLETASDGRASHVPGPLAAIPPAAAS